MGDDIKEQESDDEVNDATRSRTIYFVVISVSCGRQRAFSKH